MRLKSVSMLMIVIMIALSGLTVTQAQQNLLNDPGFEVPGDFKVILQEQGDDGVFGVPQAWDGWINTTRSQPWQNKVPNGFPHTGIFKTPAESTRSLHISRGYASFTIGVYQRVTVPDKTNLTASAWAFMERAAADVTGAQWRVGIDVAGGNNPNSPTIVWSPFGTRVNGWEQLSVSATSSGTTVTFWLYATQASPSEPNGIYFDSAVLTTGGAGGAPSVNPTNPSITNTPVIPTPAFAPFVAAQPTQSDGSIVHTVVAGDTLDAIAVAYGTTRDELIAINDLPSARFLMVGQKIIIRPARPSSSGSSAADEPTATPEGTEASSTSATRASGATNPTATVVTEETEAVTQEATESTPEATIEPTATPTPEPSATATTPPPAPVTEVARANTGVTAVCVWMFDDANQNRIQEEGEAYLQGGSIVINAGDQVVETYATTGQNEPFCFEEFATGNYTVLADAPEGYGLTTASQLSLRVQSGTRTNARFGAAQGVEQAAPPPVDLNAQPEEPAVVDETQPGAADQTQQLLQIGGLVLFGLAAVVLVGGIGLAFMLRRR